jgi:hypothetical protein
MSDAAGNSGGKKPPGRPFPPKTSGNPNGRPKGAAGLAKYLRLQTRNGKEGADFLRSVVVGSVTRVRHLVTKDGVVRVEEPPSFAESIAAQKVLYDRMHGTAQKFIELSGPGGSPLSVSLENLEHLSDEDLEALGRIARRALLGPDAPGGGDDGEGPTGSGTEG